MFLLMQILFFFFSSRRRHTRFKCDWSSDVCSSDLCGDDVTFHRERSFCALLESLKRCARFNALAPPYYAGNEIQAEKKASDSARSRLINFVASVQRQRPALWPAHTVIRSGISRTEADPATPWMSGSGQGKRRTGTFPAA